MSVEVIEIVSRTATFGSGAPASAPVAASASLLGITALAMIAQDTWLQWTNPNPVAAELRGVVLGYLDATTAGVQGILMDAQQGMGAEDEEALPERFRQAGEATPAAVSELVRAALDASATASIRRTAAIGLGTLAAGDPQGARDALRKLLADRDVGISEAAVRAIDWGGVDGLHTELASVASDAARPHWLRSYAADLAG